MIRPALLPVHPATIAAGVAAGLLALGLGACAPPPVSPARFANAPAVTAAADRADVAAAPRTRHFALMRYYFDVNVHDRVDGALRLEGPRRALDVNALDDVPDSTWFEHRIGVSDLSPDDVRRGPGDGRGPDRAGPWRVLSSKATGAAAGFIIADRAGARFVLKLDEPAFPLVETASAIVAQRLIWALGYHVPEDTLVTFDRARLQLDAGAVMADPFGGKRPMTAADLDALLARSHRRPDGRYRAVASRFLPGTPIGGFAGRGVRADDPNDTIPHQHRRSLRALHVVFGWLQQTDVKDDNTLDTWLDDGATRHVRHHLVDFGKSLGAMGLQEARAGDGHVYAVDPGASVRGVFTLGLERKPYDGVPLTGLRGVGRFDAAHYDPARWRPNAPWAPFDHVDDADRFWAARLIARLTPAHIRAAVDAAGYDDPRAAAYVADTLIARRRILLTWAFARVAPLAGFTAAGDQLCFDDLALVHGVTAPATTAYQAARYDWDGRHLGALAGARPGPRGRACVAGVTPGPSHGGYTIVRLSVTRGARRTPAVEVHLARDPAGALRVIGVERR